MRKGDCGTPRVWLSSKKKPVVKYDARHCHRITMPLSSSVWLQWSRCRSFSSRLLHSNIRVSATHNNPAPSAMRSEVISACHSCGCCNTLASAWLMPLVIAASSGGSSSRAAAISRSSTMRHHTGCLPGCASGRRCFPPAMRGSVAG